MSSDEEVDVEEEEIFEDEFDGPTVEDEEEGEEEGVSSEDELYSSSGAKNTTPSNAKNATPSLNGKTEPSKAANTARTDSQPSGGPSGGITLTDLTRVMNDKTHGTASNAMKNPLTVSKAMPSKDQKATVATPSNTQASTRTPAQFTTTSSFSQHHKEFMVEEGIWRREVSRINQSWFGALEKRKQISEMITCGVVSGYIKFPTLTLYWMGSHASFDTEPGRTLCGFGESLKHSICPIIDDTEISETICNTYKSATTHTIDKIELVSYTNGCDKPLIVSCKSHDYLNGHISTSRGTKGMTLLLPNTQVVLDRPRQLYCIRKQLASPVAQRQLLIEQFNPGDISRTQIDEGDKKKFTLVLVPSEMLEKGGQTKYMTSREIYNAFVRGSGAQSSDYYDNRYLLSFMYNQGSRFKIFGDKSLDAVWKLQDLKFKKQGSIRKATKKWWIGLEPEAVQLGLRHFQRYIQESLDLSPVRLDTLEFQIFPETTPTFTDESGSAYGFSANISQDLRKEFEYRRAEENSANKTILVELRVSLIPSVLERQTTAPAASKLGESSRENKGVNIGQGGIL